MKSENIGNLAKALCAVQSKLHGVSKDAANPFFKSRYVTLDGTWDAVRELLAANNLAVIQTTELCEGGAVLVTTLVHGESGEWMRGDYPLNPTKMDPQGLGACVTYARRYALQSILGVTAGDDDDAEGATDRNASTRPAAAKKPAPKAKETQNDLTPKQLADMRALYGILTKEPYSYERDDLVTRCLPEGMAAFSDVDSTVFDEVMFNLAELKIGQDRPAGF